MALTQQSNWLTDSLPQFAPLWEATDKLSCRWRLVAILADRADAAPQHIVPFLKIPGIGDNWEARELELPSRTAALRLSKRLAMRISRDMAKEKGHMAVWLCPIAKSEIGLVCALLGLAKPQGADLAEFPSAILCSVWPCLEAEQINSFLGAKEEEEAKKAAKREAARAKREAAAKAKADKAAALAEAIAEEQTTAADLP